MLIEIYGVTGAIAIGERYEDDFISNLIDQTCELRRDPDKREKEKAQESLEAFLEQNKGRTITTTTPDGEEVVVEF